MSIPLKKLQTIPMEQQIYTLLALPTHLTQAFQFTRLSTILTDINFIEVKCNKGMVLSLVNDYEFALDRLPDNQDEKITERQRRERINQYTRQIIDYAQKWTQARRMHAADPKNHPFPDY